jgi:hypothetical protein
MMFCFVEQTGELLVLCKWRRCFACIYVPLGVECVKGREIPHGAGASHHKILSFVPFCFLLCLL